MHCHLIFPPILWQKQIAVVFRLEKKMACCIFPIILTWTSMKNQWYSDFINFFQYFKIQNELCSILIFLQNNNNVFTGSNDGSIGIWRVRNNFDKSPDSEMSSSSWHMSSEAGQSAGGGFLTPPVQFSSPVRRPSNSSLSRLMSRSMTSSLTRL